MSATQLKQLLTGLKAADAEIRAASPCPTCGKPTAGLSGPGVTREQAGLCCCGDPFPGEPETEGFAPADQRLLARGAGGEDPDLTGEEVWN